MMAVSSRLLRLQSAQSRLDRSVWFFSFTDINLLLHIALSSSGSPHYMLCMTLVNTKVKNNNVERKKVEIKRGFVQIKRSVIYA